MAVACLLLLPPAAAATDAARINNPFCVIWPALCSDSDYTDDEVLTAAALSKPMSGGQGSHRSQAKHAVAAPAGALNAASLPISRQQ